MLAELQGEVGILNVGAGDTKLTFDPSKPKERERAAKIVEDMIKRGYSILVQVGEQLFDGKKEPIFRRAHSFDPKTCEYIVSCAPDEAIDLGLDSGPALPRKDGRSPSPFKGKKRGPYHKTTVRIPAERTRAVSVGRNAGG